MDGGCTFTFDGGSYSGTYHVPCDVVNNFDDELVYHGSGSFTVYTGVDHSGTSLYIQPECHPAYRNNNYNYVYLNPQNVVFNDRSLWYREYDLVLVFCLILLCAFRAITIFRR